MEKTSLIMFGKTVTYQHENIWVKPVCDLFKIDSEKQVVKIKNDPILAICYAKKSNKML